MHKNAVWRNAREINCNQTNWRHLIGTFRKRLTSDQKFAQWVQSAFYIIIYDTYTRKNNGTYELVTFTINTKTYYIQRLTNYIYVNITLFIETVFNHANQLVERGLESNQPELNQETVTYAHIVVVNIA